jgi:hypothetical protein
VSPQWDSIEFAYSEDDWQQESENQQKLTKLQRQKIMKSRLKKLLLAASEKASRPILEMCVTLTALSLSVACAGSGDLETLRILRALHSKVDDVNYGTHMGVGMAVGLLFLGQGKASLKRDNISLASLLLSTCPRYPSRSQDNRSHLQSLRHLYVLAVEERCLQAVDVDSGLSSPLDVEVILRNGNTMRIQIPTLLPELSSIKSVRSLSSHHFPASLGDSENLSSDGFPNTLTPSSSCCNCPQGPSPALLATGLSSSETSSLQRQSLSYTTLFIKTLSLPGAVTGTTGGGGGGGADISVKLSLRERAGLSTGLIHSCPFARRVFLEATALQNKLSTQPLPRWSPSLCLEVNLLRVLLQTFPFLRRGSFESSSCSWSDSFSLTELLSTAESSLSMECAALLSSSNCNNTSSTADMLLQNLLICGSSQSSFSQKSCAAFAFAFGLNVADLSPLSLRGNLLAETIESFKTEQGEGEGEMDVQRLLSLVSGVSASLGRERAMR